MVLGIKSRRYYPSWPYDLHDPAHSESTTEAFHTAKENEDVSSIHIRLEDREKFSIAQDGLTVVRKGSALFSTCLFSREELQRIRIMQQDWFPVCYGDDFYNQLQAGEILTLTARSSRHKKIGISHLASDPIVGLLTLRYDLSKRDDVPLDVLPELLGSCSNDKNRFLYIATLGVIHCLRGNGVAKALVQAAIKTFTGDVQSDCGESFGGKKGVDISLDSECLGYYELETTSSLDICDSKMVASACPNPMRKVGIYLQVISFNMEAKRLYERLGFVYYRTLERFYYLNGRFYDADTYIYFFDPLMAQRVSYSKS